MVEENTIRPGHPAPESCVQRQSRESLHLTAVVSFGLLMLFGTLSPFIIFAGLVLFLMVTTLPMLWCNRTLLFLCLLITAVSAAVPILAPIVAILALVLWIRRISVVLEHWRPLTAGVALYAVAFFYAVFVWMNQAGALTIAPHLLVCYGTVAAGLFAGAMHLTLRHLYRWGYVTATALGLMGAVPLIIFSLAAPFTKFHLGVDGHHGIDFGHGVGSGDHTPLNPNEHLPFAHEAHTGAVELWAAGKHVSPPSGYHDVHEYVRFSSDGEQHLVHGHIRSNPDGIIENNISYRGTASMPQPPNSPQSAEAVAISSGAIPVLPAMVKICPHCSKSADLTDDFCTGCGHKYRTKFQ